MGDEFRQNYRHSVVLHGDYSQLTAGMHWHFPRIESRMLFWCVSGAGHTWINGKKYALEPGRFFILPWASDHAYRATRSLGVGGVHVIPWYDPRAPVIYEIPHAPDDPLTGDPSRRDVPCLGLEKTFTSTLDKHPVLARQAEYIVSWFKSGARVDAVARSLGPAVLWQWIHSATAEDVHRLPTELAAVLNYVNGLSDAPFTLDDLVAVSEVSKSTLIRQFRKHLHTTPMQWATQRQLRIAGHLLRTTGLRIKQISTKCGIDDPLYFSRWFRDHTGMSPRDYRARHATGPSV